MVRSALVLGFALAVGGCAMLISLGDKPSPEPPEDAATEESPPDSQVVATADASSFLCGLPPSQNVACRSCIESVCCGEATACAADPECQKGIECIQQCMVIPSCLTNCLASSKTATLGKITDCSSLRCNVCTPGPKCQALGRCCDGLTDHILRTNCAGKILELDEATCEAYRQTVADAVDAGAGSACR